MHTQLQIRALLGALFHGEFPQRRRAGWVLWLTFLALLASVTSSFGQLTGTKAIPGDYATVAAAIAALNTQGVGAGGVTFNVAANHTETFGSPTAGIITATGTAANPIAFQKSGAGANPVVTSGAGTGTIDAIIGLAGSDYVAFNGIDVTDNPANTNTTAQAEFGYALYRASASDGCQNVTITNCTVTLNRSNSNTVGIVGTNTTYLATASIVATSAAGTQSSNKFNGNTVVSAYTGIYFNGGTSTAPSSATVADSNNEIGTTVGNTLSAVGGASTGAYGIRAESQNNLKIENNTITIPTGSTSTVRGIGTGVSLSTGILGTLLINNNTITVASATTSTVWGINQASTSSPGAVTITNNKVQNCVLTGASGAVSYIEDAYNLSSGTSIFSGNQVINNTATTTGSVTGIYRSGSGGTVNITGNYVGVTAGGVASANTMSGASGTFYGIRATTGTITLNGNFIRNNRLTNTSGTTASALYGYYNLGSPVSETLTNNTITDLSIGGASTATTHTLTGIITWTVSSAVKTITGNVIGNLALGTSGGTLSGTTTGIQQQSGTTITINQNKVYDLTAHGAGAAVIGFNIVSGTTINVTNNLVGDLRAPVASNGLAVIGLNISGGTTVNSYYNTVYLNAGSSGTNFGTAGIYASTTPTVELRNNIVVNLSTPTGTGLTAAYRRSSITLTTYGTASNNNLFYAGTPSATSLIYYDGANSDQTLAAFKTRMATRDQSSVTENPPFLSTTGSSASFLHIDPAVATQVESGGTAISGITTDYDGDTRNATTPDIGADEGAFTPQDLTPPVITYTALGNTASTANRTLTVTITDPSGVATGTGAPLVYYRKGSSGAYYSAVATSVSGSTYTFTINYANIGGAPAAGDVIQYYVAAQDVPGNAGTSPAGGTGAAPPGSTAPTAPSQYTILGTLSGDYYIMGTATAGTSPGGAAREYATLTAAVADYNSKGLGGAVRFLLFSNTQGTETYPININANSDASATNTLTILPYTGVTTTLSSSVSTALIALNGAKYVIIDGSNAGSSSRNLSLTNTSTAASTAVVWVKSLGLGAGSTNITLQNLNLTGGSNTVANFGIFAGSTSIGTNGADNDNLTIRNNNLVRFGTGIQAGGTTAVSAGGLDGLLITGNTLGAPTAATTTNIGTYGIRVLNSLAPAVTNNTIQNVITTSTTGSVYGIAMSTGTTAASITGNTVKGMSTAATSASYGAFGLYMAATSGSVNIANNTVQNISTGALAYGMYLLDADGTTLTQNTVQNVTGSGTNTTAGIMLASAFSNGTVSFNTIQTITCSGSGGAFGLLINSNCLSNSVTSNTIQTVTSTGSNSAFGLLVGPGCLNNLINRNKITDISATSSIGYGATGIDVETGSASSNLVIRNNFVQVTAASGYTALADLDTNAGIRIGNSTNASGGVKLYYNSVNMTGTDPYNDVNKSAALYVYSSSTGLDVRNNIFANGIVNSANTGAKSYAFYSDAAASAFTTINNNDYYVSGSQGVLGYLGGDKTTLADLRTATGQDAASVNVAPAFTSASDLHTLAAGLNAAATPIAGVTVDIDGDTRDASTPDIGADEFTPPAVDVAVDMLVSPVTSGCYTNAETVTVRLRNASPVDLDLTTIPVTLTATITGPNPQTLSATLNSGTLLAGATRDVVLGTLDMTAYGTYTFAATATASGDGNPANNSLSPTVALTTAAPVAGTIAYPARTLCVSGTSSFTVTGAQNGALQWQQSTDNVTFSAISGATAATYTTGTLTSTTYFRVRAYCGAAEAFSNVATVTVNNPQLASATTPVTRCGSGTVTLSATGSGGTITWYDNAATTTALSTGASYTPTVTASRQFFVAVANGTSGAAGKATASQSNGSFAGNNYGLAFTATASFVINSVTVFNATTTAGTVSVDLRDNNGAVITTVGPFAVAAGSASSLIPVVLNLNLTVPGAGSYQLTTSSTGTVPTLYRDNSSLSFPYVSATGLMSVTGGIITGSASANYYYFYNWQISNLCATARTAVDVNVTPAPALTPSATTLALCAGGSDNVTFAPSAYTLTTSPTAGATVNGSTITFAPTASTTYTVTGTDAGGCSNTATVTVTVNQPAPAITLTPTAATICAGSTTTATAALAALLTQNFNSGLDTWTVTNSGATSTAWQPVTPPYTYNTYLTIWNGADGTPFALANSDAGGISTSTNTQLISPSFSTVGYSAATLRFDQLLRRTGGSSTVEYSVSGGTWTVLATYSSNQGTNPTSASPTVANSSVTLPAGALGQADVRIRFNYVATYQYYWAIDNVQITGTASGLTYAVSPTTGASVSGSTITFSPTATTTYQVTAVSGAGCPGPATPVTITVNPLPTATASNSGPVCPGSTATVSVGLTGTAPWNLTYTDGTTPVTVTGITTSPYTFTTPALSAARTYTVTALTDANCTAATASLPATTVGLKALPTAALGNSGPVCGGNTATVTVTLTGTGPWNLTYSDGTTPVTVTGITASPYTFTTPALTANATYTITALSDAGCTADVATLPSTTVTVNTQTVWTGATSGNWFTSTNWSNCPPSRYVDAVIPAGLSRYPALAGGTGEVRTLTVASGAQLSQTAGTLNVYGNLVNNSAAANVALSGGQVAFVSSGPQALDGTQSTTFLNLLVNKSADTLRLTRNQLVTGTLTMTSGILQTTDPMGSRYKVMLSGTISETMSSFVLGDVEVSSNLSSNNATYTFGGIGLTLTPHRMGGADLPGLTTVTRTIGLPVYTGSRTSIRRTYNVQPTVDTNLNVDLVFGYLASTYELHGIAETNLTLFSAPSLSGPWKSEGFTSRSTAAHTVSLDALTHLSVWTLGDRTAPLPVTLTAFDARRQGADAVLTWTTATEKNSRGFEVQVSTDGLTFRSLGFVASETPDASTPRRYSFLDREAGKQGTRYYRLRQLDLDGREALFGPRTVAFEGATQLGLAAFPSVFDARLTVEVSSPAATGAELQLIDAVGRTLRRQPVQLQAGVQQFPLLDTAGLPSGTYVLRLTSAGQTRTVRVAKD